MRFVRALLYLLIGVLVYALWRPQAFLNGAVDLSSLLPADAVTPPDIAINTLPDAIWYVALLTVMPKLTFYPKIHPVTTVMACGLGPVHELLQLTSFVPGTFCPIDLSLYILILIIYLFSCIRKPSDI